MVPIQSSIRQGVVVTDHHRPDINMTEELLKNWTGTLTPIFSDGRIFTKISGSGATYWVARSMTMDNIDLASLAIIGAVGDFQDNSESRLIGFNRKILNDTILSGNMRAEIDIRLFGRMTRPVHSLLQYSSDPGLLPYIRNTRPSGQNINGENDDNEKLACVNFLGHLGIDLLDGDGYKGWSQLSHDEKEKMCSAPSAMGYWTPGRGSSTMND